MLLLLFYIQNKCQRFWCAHEHLSFTVDSLVRLVKNLLHKLFHDFIATKADRMFFFFNFPLKTSKNRRNRHLLKPITCRYFVSDIMNAFSWPFVNASVAFDCAKRIWILIYKYNKIGLHKVTQFEHLYCHRIVVERADIWSDIFGHR